MKKIKIIINNVLVLLLITSFANAGSFYISPSGNDSNNGSISSPWKSVSKANSMLQPGDIVYFRAGTYDQNINPARSGLQGKYITYSKYENERVVISKVTIAIDLEAKNYIRINGITFENIYDNWAHISGSFNIIEDCRFTDPNEVFTGYGGISLIGGGGHNQIINCHIEGSAMGPHDIIHVRPSSYNLIMDNTIIGGTHVGISISGKSGSSTHNIIKDNRISNRWHTSLSVWKNADNTIIEGNLITDSGEDHAINFNGSERDRTLERSGHNGIQTGGNNIIIRNNLLANNGDAIALNSYDLEFTARDNRIYNNTFYNNYTGFSIGSSGPVERNILKNNIFEGQILNHISRSPGNVPYELKIFNNDFFNGKNTFAPLGSSTVSVYESELPHVWSNNLEKDPLFENEGNLNFRLKASSPLIDKGEFLTSTTSAGSGTSLTVQDARYFFDGYGIIEGDLIQLQGQKTTARITKINGNTLTLDKSLSWTAGQGVSLAYGGAAPEIGAYEVDAATPVEPVNAAPVIKNPGNVTFIAGTSISLQIDASDPNHGDKITFSATGLPASLSINAKTGLISGIIQEGSFTVRITAKDQTGLSDEESFKIIGEKPKPIDPNASIFINAGGDLVEFKGAKWSGDQYADGGKAHSNVVAIAGTENDKIYQTARFGVYTYDIPVASGTFDVKLHFAETYFGVNRGGGVGSRIFNVKIEKGQASLQNYDIAKRAGGSATATVENLKGINVSDGFLTIAMEAIKDNPLLSAIEIVPVKNNSAPVIKNPGDLVFEEGASVSLQIDASDQDSGDKISYSASGLPASLGINSATGLITGKAISGNFQVKVRATDQHGLFGEISFKITVEALPVQSDQSITINAGGGEVTYKAEKWSSDQFAKGGSTFAKSIAIAATENDKIYQTARYGNYEYAIPVKNGSYDVKLHFAEIYFGVNRGGGVGSRVFDVDVEKGQGALRKYDIVKSAGGSATAVVEHVKGVHVTDGFLTISLTSIKDNAMLSGIEIISNSTVKNAAPIVKSPGDRDFEEGASISLQLEANDPDGDKIQFSAEGLPSGLSINKSTGLIQGTAKAGNYSIKIRVTDEKGLYAEAKFNITVIQAAILAEDSYKINSGAGKVAFNDEIWESDQNVKGGRTYSNPVAISGTDNDRIYQTNRYGNVRYEIPVSKGTYDVKLHFAEIYFGVSHSGGIGSRVFNVSVENGQGRLTRYDIFKSAGGAAKAVVERIDGITVADGFLSISLEAITENPTLSAIEVISYKKGGITAKTDDVIATKLNVYPNPFQDTFTIDFGTSEGKQIELSIFDNFGNKVYSESISPQLSTVPYEVDLSNVDLKSNEVYIIQTVENGEIIKYTRAIKK